MGVMIDDSWSFYTIYIGGLEIHAKYDSTRHRWIFKDENFVGFFETSEKKGEEIMNFLRAVQGLTKKSASRNRAATEENIVQNVLETEKKTSGDEA